MNLNVISPPAKYNIKGLVEINLNAKKGPSIGAGRENSVEKTTLSYIKCNHNVKDCSFSQVQEITLQISRISSQTYRSRLESVITKICLLNFSTVKQ